MCEVMEIVTSVDDEGPFSIKTGLSQLPPEVKARDITCLESIESQLRCVFINSNFQDRFLLDCEEETHDHCCLCKNEFKETSSPTEDDLKELPEVCSRVFASKRHDLSLDEVQLCKTCIRCLKSLMIVQCWMDELVQHYKKILQDMGVLKGVPHDPEPSQKHKPKTKSNSDTIMIDNDDVTCLSKSDSEKIYSPQSCRRRTKKKTGPVYMKVLPVHYSKENQSSASKRPNRLILPKPSVSAFPSFPMHSTFLISLPSGTSLPKREETSVNALPKPVTHVPEVTTDTEENVQFQEKAKSLVSSAPEPSVKKFKPVPPEDPDTLEEQDPSLSYLSDDNLSGLEISGPLCDLDRNSELDDMVTVINGWFLVPGDSNDSSERSDSAGLSRTGMYDIMDDDSLRQNVPLPPVSTMQESSSPIRNLVSSDGEPKVKRPLLAPRPVSSSTGPVPQKIVNFNSSKLKGKPKCQQESCPGRRSFKSAALKSRFAITDSTCCSRIPSYCRICKEVFDCDASKSPVLSQVNKHLQVHMQVKKNISTGVVFYSCEPCLGEFPSLEKLKRHFYSSHLEPMRFRCIYCGALFTRLAPFISHMGSKPYMCTFCKAPCRTESALRQHIAEHGKEVCVLCGDDQRFDGVEALKQHLRDKHGQGSSQGHNMLLQELYQWTAREDQEHKTIPLADLTADSIPGHSVARYDLVNVAERSDHAKAPKTIVCHDLKGGYLDDKFICGSQDPTGYRFYHWSCIDAFVYFSHHFVTIPPLMWINAAHLHGVKVLGTLITEWEDGSKLCKALLESEESIARAVQKLTEVAQFYGFEGWLINIENDLRTGEPEAMNSFLSQLSISMKGSNPNGMVLWYDAVTVDGKLLWQNELNDKNLGFFQVCDGIVVNYTWKDEGPDGAKGNLQQSIENAKHRVQDVFIGLDAFGRGMLGGGGFNTKQVSARGKLSPIIGSQHSSSQQEVRAFSYVKDEGGRPWLNLSQQQHQPSFPVTCPRPFLDDDALVSALAENDLSYVVESMRCLSSHLFHMQAYADEAFDGGSSILFSADEAGLGSPFGGISRMLVCGFSVVSGLEVTYAIKPLGQGKDLEDTGLLLRVVGHLLVVTFYLGEDTKSGEASAVALAPVSSQMENQWEIRQNESDDRIRSQWQQEEVHPSWIVSPGSPISDLASASVAPKSAPRVSLSFFFLCVPLQEHLAFQVQVLGGPEEFYEELKQKAREAKWRITLASLYLGTGDLEEELVKKIEESLKARNGNLEVNILLDATRGSRGRVNSRSLLLPLLKQYEENVQVSLYHTPELRGIWKWLLPAQWNELVGLQHVKVYLFDNTLIMSGANLSHDYFTNRQDRYVVFENCPLVADFFHELVSTISCFSFRLTPEDKLTLHPSWNEHPVNGELTNFKFQASKSIKNLLQKYRDALQRYPTPRGRSNRQETMTTVNRWLDRVVHNGEKPAPPEQELDTVVYPLIQMGPLGICHDRDATLRLMQEAPARSLISLATGYFNLTEDYKRVILLESSARFHVITAHPQANGFYKAKWPAGGIPAGYTLLMRKFFEKLRGNRDAMERVRLFEYQRPNWTFHAKGLWLSVAQEELPCLTFIGSPNFGHRSLHRDLEAQVALLTTNRALRMKLEKEQERLFAPSHPVTTATFEDPERWVPYWTVGVCHAGRWKMEDEDEVLLMLPETDGSIQYRRTPTKCSRRCSARYTLAAVGFVGFFHVYAMRVNLSVGIVAMTNSSSHPLHHSGAGNSSWSAEVYNWDEEMQGMILSAFFWGYIVTQIPGGLLAQRFGSKHLYGFGCLITAIFTLLTPLAAHLGARYLVAVRVIEGLGEGVTFPAMHALLAKWVPPLERTKIAAFVYSGATLGTVVALPLSGVLAHSPALGGWPSIFYFFGVTGIIWWVFWCFLAYDSPDDHPWISPAEKQTIANALRQQVKPGHRFKVPYKAILKSAPFYAILVAHVGQNWGYYTLLTQMPKYMKDVLGYNLQEDGFMSAVPYLAAFIMANMGSIMADGFRSRNLLSTGTTRRLFNTFAFWVSGFSLLGVSWVGRNRTAAMSFMTLGMGFNALAQSGYNVNHIDIAPNHAGFLLGVTNCFATLPGILSPLATGSILQAYTQYGTLLAWQLVFTISGWVLIGANVIYILLCSGDVQPWNQCSIKKKEKDEERTA
ncbi:unnamed protein product [Darwinula stevensoni]|uniref:CDP-diacylglycerol--glycerol-3-phosphate 3-phosphatidyltransferase, mitochondrial n=2 Tax=Darwinula stevensoni TaxID=69355 RepID=A0A7R9A7P4_9CRUS|nr:unnamed protein product [Darwinula stevensoni]CAG0892873.1 unnamed protein product [Darwinula stevensoni]